MGLLFQRLWAVGPNFGLRSNKKRSSPVKFGPNGIFVIVRGGARAPVLPPLATPLAAAAALRLAATTAEVIAVAVAAAAAEAATNCRRYRRKF